MKKITQSNSVRLGYLKTSAQLRNGHDYRGGFLSFIGY